MYDKAKKGEPQSTFPARPYERSRSVLVGPTEHEGYLETITP